MPRGCKTLCTLAAVASLLQAAPALAVTRTASAGAVTATVTWSDDGPYPSDLHVKIVRAGVTLVDEPVTDPNSGDFYGPRPGEHPVAVSDLDRDGEPEVLLDESSGGAHCCTTTKLWSFEDGAYRRVEYKWNNATYKLGATLLVGRDDWAYILASNAASFSPVRVLDGRLRDVTREHPRLIRRDIRLLRRASKQYAGTFPLPAIAADYLMLGLRKQAERELAKLPATVKGKAERLLSAGGYW